MYPCSTSRRRAWEYRYSSTHSFPQYWIPTNGQLHSPVAGPSLSIGYARWAQELQITREYCSIGEGEILKLTIKKKDWNGVVRTEMLQDRFNGGLPFMVIERCKFPVQLKQNVEWCSWGDNESIELRKAKPYCRLLNCCAHACADELISVP